MPVARDSTAPQIAIAGLTAWGLGLAFTYARAGRDVLLLARTSGEAEAVERSRRHQRLPGAELPENVSVRSAAEADLIGLNALIVAVPSQQMRGNLRLLAPHLDPATAVVSAAKGLEHDTQLRMSQVICEELKQERPPAALSGPNLVPEIVAGLPAAAVLASTDQALAGELQALLATPLLRLYTSQDVIGVEIGGALKNVIALAAGLGEGLGYGDNSTAALITRGLAEIVRLGLAMGAEALTFSGLSGLGDLLATCGSPLSRNHRAGLLLAQGLSIEAVQERIGEVVEGIETTAAARALAGLKDVEMPITQLLFDVLYGGLPPQSAAATLMLRDLTDESPVHAYP